MRIVGSKYCGHDSALCLIDTEKKSIFALSTERVTRIKHDFLDITPILEHYDLVHVDWVAHSYADFEDKSEDGELKAQMIYNKEIEKALRSIIKPNYIKDLSLSKKEKRSHIIEAFFSNFDGFKRYYKAKFKRAFTKNNQHNNKKTFTRYITHCFNENNLYPKGINFYDHHLCHAVPSYYFSPYNGQKAIALTLDGQGDGFFSKAYLFDEKKQYRLIGASQAKRFGSGNWFLSLGRIYHYFTEAMDLRGGSDEGKVEALAAFGNPQHPLYTKLKEATHIDKQRLSIEFDIEKITPFYTMEWLKKERETLGDENFCAVVQHYLETTVIEYLDAIYEQYPIPTLCLSGGVSANIIMSLNIYEKTPFKHIFVLPAMGDDGLALGSAILTAIDHKEDLSWLKEQTMPYFGDDYSKKEVEEALKTFDTIDYEYLGDSWPKHAANSVAKGKVCALFHGKMEFGPRALGNRSIIATPTIETIRDKINSTVKRRPSYQPFCPSILEEERERLFTTSFPHKHMAIAFRMKEEHIPSLPCAVHVDGTARPQFVEEQDNPNYYAYLKELKALTGYGVSLNTSFNLHGRTIVRTPYDAVTDFIDCTIDELYIEGYKVTIKTDTNPS